MRLSEQATISLAKKKVSSSSVHSLVLWVSSVLRVRGWEHQWLPPPAASVWFQ